MGSMSMPTTASKAGLSPASPRGTRLALLACAVLLIAAAVSILIRGAMEFGRWQLEPQSAAERQCEHLRPRNTASSREWHECVTRKLEGGAWSASFPWLAWGTGTLFAGVIAIGLSVMIGTSIETKEGRPRDVAH